MISLLADVNIKGHIDRLVARMRSEQWRDFWDYLDVRLLTFSDLGLCDADSDRVVWQRCQEKEVLLLTNNRNAVGLDSLEMTIRALNTAQSLPVFTIADPDRILSNADYADSVIDRLFQNLLQLDDIRGTGRIFLP